MNYWLYQMAAYGDASDDEDDRWRPRDYRKKVCEKESVTWEWYKPMSVNRRGRRGPVSGDKIVFFFCKTGLKGKEKPGIYGWGEIEFFRNNTKGRCLTFRVTPPSDALKLSPLWGRAVEKLVNEIRGNFTKRTLWEMTNEQFNRLYEKMLAKVEAPQPA